MKLSLAIEKVIGRKTQNEKLFVQALTHKSYAFENQLGEDHNEKLEFLGDAVVDLVLAQELMNQFALDQEGALSKKRASLVNESVLSEIALELGLQNLIRLGKGEILSGGAQRPRILSSAYEAMVGAYFQQFGYEAARVWIRGHFEKKTSEVSEKPDYEKDFKTRLQVLSQDKLKCTPIYELIQESGPAHKKEFEMQVVILNRKWQGSGTSKKIAEQKAAECALLNLEEEFKLSSELLDTKNDEGQRS